MASGRGSNFDALYASTSRPGHPAKIVLLATDHAEAPVVAKAEAVRVKVELLDPGTPRGAWTRAAVDSLLTVLRHHSIDAILLAGFMRIVPEEVVRKYRHRILNIHPSLLPAFPGLRAQRQALRAGVKVSGCTVHFVDDGIDTGPIVFQEPVEVDPDDTEDTLAQRILAREHVLYPRALLALAENRIQVMGRITRTLPQPPAR
jgi:phosphoribosylglycinamide formyltransferase-1